MTITTKWTTQTDTEEWTVTAEGGRVVLTRCTGPFGLPVQRVEIAGGVAHTVAKSIAAAQKLARNQVTPGL